jgi:hypothetical protein
MFKLFNLVAKVIKLHEIEFDNHVKES